MTKVIERSKEALSADFPSGKVIFHAVSRRIYILNKTASALWDYCRKPKDADSLIKYLNKEYAVSPARAGRDVKAFIDGMRKRKVIRLYARKDRV